MVASYAPLFCWGYAYDALELDGQRPVPGGLAMMGFGVTPLVGPLAGGLAIATALLSQHLRFANQVLALVALGAIVALYVGVSLPAPVHEMVMTIPIAKRGLPVAVVAAVGWFAISLRFEKRTGATTRS